MAITRIFQATGETNGADSLDTEWDDYYGGTTCVNTIVKSGNRSYQFNEDGDYLLKTIPDTYQLRLGFHVQIYNYDTGSLQNVLRLMAGTTTLVNIRNKESEAKWLLEIGGVAQTDTWSYKTNRWYHIGLDVKINASAGWARLYVNGELVISEDSANTGSSEIDTVKMGPDRPEVSNDVFLYFDNLFVDDTTGEGSADVVPEYLFEPITPNGNGNYSQFDGSDGNQVDNYLQVDDLPHDSDTTYNEAQAADEIDSYAMTTFSLPARASIASLIPWAVIKKTNAVTASQAAMMVRESATNKEGSAQDLPSDYDLIFERFTTDAGSDPWVQAILDAVEVGVWAEGTF